MTHLLDKSAYAIEHTCRFIAIECRGLEPTWNQHWVPSPTFNVAYGLASGVLISHPIEPIAGRRMGHGEDPDMFAKVRELSRVGPVLGILRAMTRALDTAIAKLTTLPSDEQDRIAQWLLEELRDEEQWARQFTASQGHLSKLAAEARADRDAGKTTELDPDKL